MVQAVKRSLQKVLFRAAVNYEELQTVIIEIEGVINSRPLTYIYNEVEDVLTPSHLLLGRRLLSESTTTWHKPEDEPNNAKLTKRMKYLQKLADHYWKRFTEEYLVELRSQHVQGTNATRTAEVGEIVVIHGQTKRKLWRLGKVISCIYGSDGQVRAVVLKVFDGMNSRYIRRPIEKLYPLDQKEIDESKGTIDDIEPPDEERPKRRAADTGTLIRRLMGHT